MWRNLAGHQATIPTSSPLQARTPCILGNLLIESPDVCEYIYIYIGGSNSEIGTMKIFSVPVDESVLINQRHPGPILLNRLYGRPSFAAFPASTRRCRKNSERTNGPFAGASRCKTPEEKTNL